MRWGDFSSFGSPERMRSSRQGKGKAMEDFLTSFFITPFTGLAEGIATATSPLDVIDAVDGFVWGPIMILLLLGTHIFMTIRTGFIQRKLPTAIKLSVTKDPDAPGDISQFGALTTALSATIGTGNIVGVGTAILAGGPGAVLWMWLTGILGMATKYTEVYAAMKYRVKDRQGHMMGGAMHVWEQRYKRPDGTVPWWAKFMAIWFAVMACLTIFGVGSAVQTSAITSVAQANFGVEPWIVAAIVCGSALLIIMGGLGTISSICEKLVPIMGVAYILGCAYILVCNWAFIGESFRLIFECAFTPRAAFGGAVGSGIIVALQFGCARGLFSNESGLGSAPIVASAASTRNPARQALVSMTGTFWDTVVICALTGIVLVSTMLANPDIASSIMANPTVYSGAMLASEAFAKIPYIGTPILVLGMVAFSYTTILGWSYYGERAAEYLIGRRAILPYKLVFLAVVVFSPVLALDLVWTIADVLNALMAIPNLVAVLLLSGVIAKETRHYLANLDEKDTAEIPVVRR